MWPNPHFLVDLVTFTEEILNGKLHFFGSVDAPLTKNFKNLYINEIDLTHYPTKRLGGIHLLSSSFLNAPMKHF